MYEAHFQMHRRPFPPSADVSTYVGVGPVEEAGQTLLRVIQRGSGPGLVVGSAGTGKSMLCELLAEHFGQRMHVALLANGQLANPRALFQAILFELGLPYREMDENELRLALVEFLTDVKRCPLGLLLIVDEAHCLPLRILEEIRMLTNLVRDGQSRVHLVLAGGTALEERFTNPKLDSFNQRIAARCYLERLSREETVRYICEQVTAAGGNAETTFHNDAMAAVYDATDGIPRLVNQLCDHALVMAAVGGHTSVTSETVQEAWADLQQLPAPWLEPSTAKHAAAGEQHVIEFGALDDGDDPTPASIPFSQRSEDDEAGGAPSSVEAEQQLAEIERQVADASATYDEASTGSSRAAAPAANPFEESFDEEEEVVDNYAMLQETRFANAPRVASRQGREIAALLPDTLREEEAGDANTTGGERDARDEAFVPTVSVVDEDEESIEQDAGADEPIAAGQSASAAETEEEVETVEVVKMPQRPFDQSNIAEADDAYHEDDHVELAGDEDNPAGQRSEEDADIDPLAQQQQQELTEAVATLLQSMDEEANEDVEPAADIHRFAETASEPPENPTPIDDRDMIIVEEPAEAEAPERAPPGRAKRQKYRQLFNRLRQA